MAKDPVLPLYYNDITTSTQDWTDEEFGAYMRLLIHQWRQGGLPKDYQRLTRIATSLDTNWALLKQKFEEVDGLLKNPVMEHIREKRARHKEKQSENALKRYQKSTNDPAKHMPLEEEKEIEKEKEKEVKGVQGEFPEQKFEEAFDDIYIQGQQMSWREIDVPEQLRQFKVKVRGSPSRYMHRDTDGLRLAFQSQLRTAKPKQKYVNGKSSEGTPTTTVIQPGKSFGIEKGFSRSGANGGGDC